GMAKDSAAGSGGTSIRLQRTDTPSGRSTMAATYGTGTSGEDWWTIEYTQSFPVRDSRTSSKGPRAVHRLHASRRPRKTAPQAVQRCPARYGSPSAGKRRKGTIGRRPGASLMARRRSGSRVYRSLPPARLRVGAARHTGGLRAHAHAGADVRAGRPGRRRWRPLARFADPGQREKCEKTAGTFVFSSRSGFASPAPLPYTVPHNAKAWICGLEGGARALVVPREHVGGGGAERGSALDPRREHLGPGQGPRPGARAATRKGGRVLVPGSPRRPRPLPRQLQPPLLGGVGGQCRQVRPRRRHLRAPRQGDRQGARFLFRLPL